MRTTLSIDDDVLAAVKERAQREHTSVGAVLSGLARRALTGDVLPVGGEGAHGFVALPSRGVVVSNALIDRLREEEPE